MSGVANIDAMYSRNVQTSPTSSSLSDVRSLTVRAPENQAVEIDRVSCSSKGSRNLVRVGGTDSTPSLVERHRNNEASNSLSFLTRSRSSSSSSYSDENEDDWQKLTVQNVCWRLLRFQNERQEVVEHILHFIYVNLADVIDDPTWSMIAKPHFLLKLFEYSARITAPSPEIEPSFMIDKSIIDYGLRHLWDESRGLTRPTAHSDFVVTTKDGKLFYIHRQILFLVAPLFVQYLDEESKRLGSNRIRIKSMDAAVIREFLTALYQQKPSPDFNKLAELVYVLACDYQVEELRALCERQMATRQLVNVQSALEMLRDAEERRMNTVKLSCFRYLYENANQLKNNEDWDILVQEEPQLLTEMILESKEFRRIIPPI